KWMVGVITPKVDLWRKMKKSPVKFIYKFQVLIKGLMGYSSF
ncbi:uncharacterized protein METZ01_LOCUS128613, partial [marine metagenome]